MESAKTVARGLKVWAQSSKQKAAWHDFLNYFPTRNMERIPSVNAADIWHDNVPVQDNLNSKLKRRDEASLYFMYLPGSIPGRCNSIFGIWREVLGRNI